MSWGSGGSDSTCVLGVEGSEKNWPPPPRIISGTALGVWASCKWTVEVLRCHKQNMTARLGEMSWCLELVQWKVYHLQQHRITLWILGGGSFGWTVEWGSEVDADLKWCTQWWEWKVFVISLIIFWNSLGGRNMEVLAGFSGLGSIFLYLFFNPTLLAATVMPSPRM